MQPRTVHPVLALPAMLAGALVLAACGGGSTSGSGGSGSGSLTLAITDAAVDSAAGVNVVFTGITLKPQDGDPITFECDQPAADPAFDCDGKGYREIDLMTLTGDESETLLDGVELAAGRFEWIRLHVNAKAPGWRTLPDPLLPGSTIVLDDGSEPDLLVPSGPQTGLKLVQGFSVPAGGSASFTIDFVLRRAVVHAKIGHLLRPAFRLIDNSNAGRLVGEITNSFVQTNCPDRDGDGSGDATGGLAVYLYEGSGATAGDLGDAANEPLITDAAELDPADGNYDYGIGFLEAGHYTGAVTCEADSDGEDSDDTLQFVATADVMVTAGEPPTVQNFE